MVTTTGPVLAPDVTFTTICASLQLLAVAAVAPLNFTLLDPSVAPKLEPLIVTVVSIGPEVGEMQVMIGLKVVLRRTETLLLFSLAETISGLPS